MLGRFRKKKTKCNFTQKLETLNGSRRLGSMLAWQLWWGLHLSDLILYIIIPSWRAKYTSTLYIYVHCMGKYGKNLVMDRKETFSIGYIYAYTIQYDVWLRGGHMLFNSCCAFTVRTFQKDHSCLALLRYLKKEEKKGLLTITDFTCPPAPSPSKVWYMMSWVAGGRWAAFPPYPQPGGQTIHNGCFFTFQLSLSSTRKALFSYVFFALIAITPFESFTLLRYYFGNSPSA